MLHHFVVGEKYTRAELRKLTGQSPGKKGGNWDTGYAELKGEFFIFCTIDGAGRTGHNYGNHFHENHLVWKTKGDRTRNSLQTKRLLAKDVIKYLFTRDNDRPEFTYRGTVQAKSIKGDSPVEVLWAIDAETSNSPTQAQPRYFARLCWNSACWVYPTGDAAKTETGTFANEFGFGGEEWLFDFSRLIDGYKYGYLQGVSFSYKRISGTEFSADLYTHAPEGHRLLVGKIKTIRALTEQEAENAKERFVKNGWLQLMSQQIQSAGGKANSVNLSTPGINTFNVRFRVEDVEIFDPYVPVPENHPVYRLKRYQLIAQELGEADSQDIKSASRQGSRSLKSTAAITRRSSVEKKFDPVHSKMQNELFQLLSLQFGEQAVLMEENFVDITISAATRTIFIEVKTDPTPRKAIRQALGQLLDYAFFDRPPGDRHLELVVIGPGKMSPKDVIYLKTLIYEFKIPITYLQFGLGNKEFRIPTITYAKKS